MKKRGGVGQKLNIGKFYYTGIYFFLLKLATNLNIP